MNDKSIIPAIKIWGLTALQAAIVLSVFIALEESFPLFGFFIVLFAVAITTFPALVALAIFLYQIRRSQHSYKEKTTRLFLLLFCITFLYALLMVFFNLATDSVTSEFSLDSWEILLISNTVLLMSTLVSCSIIHRSLFRYLFQTVHFTNEQIISFFFTTNNNKMEPSTTPTQPATSNKILFKGLITGGLILLLLIPTIFISNLITEREARHKEVVKEVSSKWASAQTLSSPFLTVPYTYTYSTGDGKMATASTNIILLANEATVTGELFPEQRPRSIYKVLLYRSQVNFSGHFKPSMPVDIDSSKLDLDNAKICFTLSDFKGIEEDVSIKLGQENLLLRPGLPVDDFGKIGLSAPVKLTAEQIATGLDFNMQIKLRGSEQLHFIPMSASSKFNVHSKWNDPSFDGEMLPNERKVTQEGFNAHWSFNQANLPFALVMKQSTVGDRKMDFGVSLVQPADQYNKTMRSVKYAILFIGLSFAFFFIIELMQKKPFHPVQYVLVGIALVIFYTLLLSISEYLPFDTAYLIAALATISLISLYAKGHFKSWKTAAVFFSLLSMLYAFIFVLIRLEDTALLVGSIGLFVVLALIMFVSQKINWYGRVPQQEMNSPFQPIQNV